MRSFLLSLIFILTCSTYAIAQTPEEDVKAGMELMKQEKFDTAFNHFMAAANHKNYEGMYFAGNMYRLGVGTEMNRIRAYVFLRLAADSGAYPRAYEALGNMYFEDKKMDTAKYYLEKAMEFIPSSAGVLGAIYFEEGNSRKALPFIKEGVKLEDPVSMYYLGQMYYDGDGIQPNEKEAVRWLQRAAKKGYKPALSYLEDIGLDDLEDLDEMDNPKQKRSKKQKKDRKKIQDEDDEEVEIPVKKHKKVKVQDEDDNEDAAPKKRKSRKSKNTEGDEFSDGADEE